MASVDSLELAQACPAEETLIGFNLGKLSATEEEAIVTHIASCTRCESILQRLNQEPPNDTLLNNVRRCFASELALEESACAELEAYARRLSLGSTAPSVSTEALARSTGRNENWIGRKIDNYLILDVIGQGGMGVVFKARQDTVNHVVALKMVQGGVWANPKTVRRFRTEGQAVARLRHPHVVQIYNFDEHDGLPFFAMELLTGGTLARRLSKGALEPREAAELVAKLADAVAFAHQNHVIHRDLKPSNVLLDAHGSPKISDFGLAKLLDAEEGDTRSQEILGTPAYMAPEQAEGKTADIGAATDVYALGVILYEALTGRPPFRGADRVATLCLVLSAELTPPSKLRKGLHRDLEAICVKCLGRRPDERYRSAEELAEDLRRWLRAEPTNARPPGWMKSAWHRLRKYRTAAALGVLLCAGVATAYFLDPNRPVRALEAELADGKETNLLDDAGNPRYVRWRAGRDTTQTSVNRDGSFWIHAMDAVLLELAPDPQGETYRFTAEVRHKSAPQVDCVVGIYVAHQAFPGESQDIQTFTALKFNGCKSWPTRPIINRPRAKQNLPITNTPVWLNAMVYSGERSFGGGVIAVRKELVVPTIDTVDEPAPWHRLEILVTPDQLHGRWDGEPVGKLSPEVIKSKLSAKLSGWSKKFPNNPYLPSVLPNVHLRGGLGLYMTTGSASFRNLSVTPLKNGAD